MCWRFMIHTARKLLALVLIAAFTAGFAQPLVWCVSGPDHSRIEFKIGGNGHEASLPERAQKRHSKSFSLEGSLAPDDCIDSEFFPEAVESAAVDLKATPAQAPASLKWGLLPPVRAPATPVVSVILPEPPSFRVAASQLKHIRTVVLLT